MSQMAAIAIRCPPPHGIARICGTVVQKGDLYAATSPESWHPLSRRCFIREIKSGFTVELKNGTLVVWNIAICALAAWPSFLALLPPAQIPSGYTSETTAGLRAWIIPTFAACAILGKWTDFLLKKALSETDCEKSLALAAVAAQTDPHNRDAIAVHYALSEPLHQWWTLEAICWHWPEATHEMLVARAAAFSR